MAKNDDCHSGQKPETFEHKEIGQRRSLEEALQAAQEDAAQLDKHIHIKGDYGHGRGVVDWELNLALRRQMEREIEQLDAALRQMDEGHYGECRACGKVISPERQEALPYATLCVACARSGQAELVP